MAIHCLNLIAKILFPGTCLLCQHTSERNLDLCTACETDLPWLKGACPRCGLLLPNFHSNTQLCGACLSFPPSFIETQALFHYQHEISHLLTALKFNHQLAIARILGQLMANHLLKNLTTYPECVIPMPLHSSRLRERGFNQALELARPLAKQLKIPLELKACQRIKPTVAQTSIDRCQREENVKHAFFIEPSFSADHVVILDDVMTTGHTVSALTEALLQGHVKRVDVWCCARTQKFV